MDVNGQTYPSKSRLISLNHVASCCFHVLYKLYNYVAFVFFRVFSSLFCPFILQKLKALQDSMPWRIDPRSRSVQWVGQEGAWDGMGEVWWSYESFLIFFVWDALTPMALANDIYIIYYKSENHGKINCSFLLYIRTLNIDVRPGSSNCKVPSKHRLVARAGCNRACWQCKGMACYHFGTLQ